MSAEFADLSLQYNRHQSGLVKEVVGIAASYTPVLQLLGAVLGHLDVIVRYPYQGLGANAVSPTYLSTRQRHTSNQQCRNVAKAILSSLKRVIQISKYKTTSPVSRTTSFLNVG